MNSSPTSRPWWRPPSVWTPWDTFLVKVGAGCIAFGVLAHLLPHFGLQLRKLSQLENAAGTVGTGVGVVGLLLIAYVVVLKGRVLKAAAIAAALAVVAIVGILVIGWIESRRFARPGPAMPTGSATSPAARPPMPGTPPQLGGARGQPPMPAGITPPPPMDYDSLVARFGKDRVVRLTITNADGFDLGATIRKRFEAMPAATRPGSWRVTFSGAQGTFIAAPVNDLAAFLDALRLGDVIAMDQANHSAEIALDQSKAIRKTGSP